MGYLECEPDSAQIFPTHGFGSFCTPVLALLGVPALVAVASPLPATIPAAVVDAVPGWLASFRAAAPAGRPSCGLTVTTRSTLVSPSRPRAEPAV